MNHKGEKQLEELFADYVDRLNAGETLDAETILAENPLLGEDLLNYLDQYLDSVSDNEPLGTLGDYTLRRQIGRGGMGVVYEAWENSMDRAVALKVLPAGVAADDRAFQRFMQEAKTAGKLSHQNIVPVYSTGVKEGTPWFSMEFVEGETLAQILAKLQDAEPETETPFGPKEDLAYFSNLARAFADVADGLQHAHGKGVIHRDIKPSNLILDHESRLRILDFGLARLEGQESLTLSGDFVGTPLYMSPEQARRKKIEVDHRTDVYSLGATLYEAICGRPPFRGKDHADTLSQIIERDPVEPRKACPRVPRDLETVVLKCLRKDAASRYGTAEALAQDLRRFARGDSVEARPLSAVEVWTHRAKRHRARLALLALLLVSSALAIAVLSFGLRASSERRWARYVDAVEQAVMDIEYGRFVRPRSRRRSLAMREPEAFLLTAERCSDQLGAASVLDGAVARLDEAIGLEPTAPDARYHKARALYHLGRDEDAQAVLRETLRSDPGFLPARVLLGILDREEVLASDPGSNAWTRAQQAMESGDWTTAEVAFTRLLSDEEGTRYRHIGSRLETMFGRGIARLADGRWLAAAEDMVAVLEHWPASIAAKMALGRAYLMLADGGAGDAERVFLEAWNTAPDAVKDEVALEISRTLSFNAGDIKKDALRWIGRVSDRCPVQRAVYELFYIYMDSRGREPARLKAAIVSAEDVLREHPNSPELLGVLAMACAFEQRHNEKARRYIRQAIALGDGRMSVAFMAAWTSYYLGPLDDVESTRWFRRCIELDEDFGPAYGNLARILIDNGDANEAVKVCEAGIERDPFCTQNRFVLARALRLSGKLEDAEEALEKTLAIWDRDPAHFVLLGEIREAAGDAVGALAAYQRAIQLDPKNTSVLRTAERVLNSDSLPAQMNSSPAVETQMNWILDPANPIDSPFRFNNVPSVVYDNEREVWRAWYGPGDTDIAYAESKDGVHWEPDPPAVVLSASSGEDWESCWKWAPSVIYDPAHPSAVVDDEGEPYAYQMWYTGFNCEGVRGIGYAVSHDGRNWIRPVDGPVLTRGDAGEWDERGIHLPSVLYDADEGLFRMWYTGGPGDGPSNILLATSGNGFDWEKRGPIELRRPGEGSTINCDVIHNGTHYEMWFSVRSGGRWAIHYARSLDGITWTRPTSSRVVGVPSGGWDAVSVCNPKVHFNGGSYRAWFSGDCERSRLTGTATFGAALPRPHFRIEPESDVLDSRPVTFDASRSNSPLVPDATPGDFSYAWDFGDGETAKGVTVEHAYDSPGDYRVRLTFSDGLGSARIERLLRVGTESRFRRGDCNDDGTVDISDAMTTLGSLFLGEGESTCDDACDSNDDGAVNISDAIATLGVLFLGNGIISPPGMTECGDDSTGDALECEHASGCR